MTTERDGNDRRSGSRTNDSLTRRRWLASAGGVTATLLAGCIDGGSGEVDGQGTGPDESPPDGEGDRDAAETDEPDESETPEADPDESPPDDEGDRDATETDEPDGSETPESDAGTDDPPGTETESEASCDEVVPVVEDSVEVEGTMEHPEDGTVDIQGRTHGDDSYYEFVNSNGMTYELFIVDGEYHTITEGNCITFSDLPETGYAAPEDEFSEAGFWEDKDPLRTEVLDGEEMVVYELQGETPHYGYELTVFVNCATQRIHRVDQYVPSENASTIAYYENWGSTDPVTPPEMDCQEI